MSTDDPRLVSQAIEVLRAKRGEQPGLADLASELGTDPFHLQRVFRRFAGISPKRFLQILTLEFSKDRLRAGSSLLQASLDAGLSGPSRLHDHFVSIEAMSPGEWRNGGAGMKLEWGTATSPFGTCALAWTSRGLCALRFVESEAAAEAEIEAAWPGALRSRSEEEARRIAARAFSAPAGDRLLLHLRGTNFQVRVWQALLEIPAGRVACYADVARRLGDPAAARAVGSAVGANPIAYLIPCHRVLRRDGGWGGYRWGLERKRAMLAREHAVAEADRDSGSDEGRRAATAESG